jgi:hypothetical protein|tara:strand:+ start:556 stop:735 length:180 start_codon:yes stop_codon:yes gene_type:complete
MERKIRSISISPNIDKQLEEDSRHRGLTISANVSRILYEYLQKNTIPKKTGITLSAIKK